MQDGPSAVAVAAPANWRSPNVADAPLPFIEILAEKEVQLRLPVLDNSTVVDLTTWRVIEVHVPAMKQEASSYRLGVEENIRLKCNSSKNEQSTVVCSHGIGFKRIFWLFTRIPFVRFWWFWRVNILAGGLAIFLMRDWLAFVLCKNDVIKYFSSKRRRQSS